MNRKSTLIPEPIAQLQRQLDEFRSTHATRTKLPEPLWRTAVELARQHGVHAVAHPLRMDYIGVTPPLIKYCTLRNETGFAGPEGARFAVAEPRVLAPVVITSQVDVLPFEW